MMDTMNMSGLTEKDLFQEWKGTRRYHWNNVKNYSVH